MSDTLNPFAIAHAIRKKNAPSGEPKEIDPNYEPQELGRLASTRGPSAIAAAILEKKTPKAGLDEDSFEPSHLDALDDEDLYTDFEPVEEEKPEDVRKGMLASIFENF